MMDMTDATEEELEQAAALALALQGEENPAHFSRLRGEVLKIAAEQATRNKRRSGGLRGGRVWSWVSLAVAAGFGLALWQRTPASEPMPKAARMSESAFADEEASPGRSTSDAKAKISLDFFPAPELIHAQARLIQARVDERAALEVQDEFEIEMRGYRQKLLARLETGARAPIGNEP